MNSCRKDFLRFLSKQLAVAQHFKKLLGFSRNFLFEIRTSSCLRDLSFLAAKLICASKDYLAFLNIFRQNFPFLIRWQFEKKKVNILLVISCMNYLNGYNSGRRTDRHAVKVTDCFWEQVIWRHQVSISYLIVTYTRRPDIIWRNINKRCSCNITTFILTTPGNKYVDGLQVYVKIVINRWQDTFQDFKLVWR